MTTFLTGLLRLRRGPWEMLATILLRKHLLRGITFGAVRK
jgi:hypothetical protein